MDICHRRQATKQKNGIINGGTTRKERNTDRLEGQVQAVFAALPATVARVIKEPGLFFRQMPRTGGLVEPLAFLMVMNVVSALLQSVLNLFHIGFVPATVPSLAVVVIVPFITVIFGFVVSSVLFVIWRLMGSREPYEVSFRCLAYTSSISPLTVLLRAIPVAGGLMGLWWTAYIAVKASVETHKIKAITAWIVFGAIFAVFSLISVWIELAGHGIAGV